MAASRPDRVPRQRNRVVVVDDQPDLRELIALILGDEDDFDVVGCAGDGAEAVRLVTELRPDLVVMDVAMPVMTGLEALKALRVTTPGTRVVMLSAHPRESVPSADRQLADEYFDKEIVVTDLVQRLRGVCERPAKDITAAG